MHLHGTPPPRKRSTGRTLAWIGCGCATLLLLVVGGGGAAAAYYLGWFSGSGAYDADPEACTYLDTGLAAGIATSSEPEVQEPEIPETRRSHCALGAEADDGGNPVALTSTVYHSDTKDLVRENGVERADETLMVDNVDHYGLAELACDGGWPAYVGDDGRDPEYATAIATTRDSNLVLSVQIEANGAAGLGLDERTDAAHELLCAAVERARQVEPPA